MLCAPHPIDRRDMARKSTLLSSPCPNITSLRNLPERDTECPAWPIRERERPIPGQSHLTRAAAQMRHVDKLPRLTPLPETRSSTAIGPPHITGSIVRSPEFCACRGACWLRIDPRRTGGRAGGGEGGAPEGTMGAGFGAMSGDYFLGLAEMCCLSDTRCPWLCRSTGKSG